MPALIFFYYFFKKFKLTKWKLLQTLYWIFTFIYLEKHKLYKMIEIWKDIIGYEGYYKISNMGRLMTMERFVENKNPRLYGRNRHIKQRILNYNVHKSGYILVILSKDKEKKYFSIHRLVASAFIDNEKNLPCVNHIDENKSNNIVSNLEWCSYEYNNNFGKKENKTIKTKKLNVIQYDKNNNFVKKWNSIEEISNESNHKKYNILKCCNGERKTHHGFKWKFDE